MTIIYDSNDNNINTRTINNDDADDDAGNSMHDNNNTNNGYIISILAAITYLVVAKVSWQHLHFENADDNSDV